MHVLFQTKSVFTNLIWLLRSFLKIITELIYLNDFIIVFLFIMFIIFMLLILFIIFIISLSLLYLMILSYLFQSFTKFFIKGPFSISSRVSWMSRANRMIKILDFQSSVVLSLVLSKISIFMSSCISLKTNGRSFRQ